MDLRIEPYSGKSRRTGNDYHCFKLTIGEWSTFIFPSTQFEYNYIKKVLEEHK